MSKDEPPRSSLLSKVARFVLHPTVNWSDLDSRLPGTGTEEDRLALKAAIERKRRNDQVRHREFNALRAQMQKRRVSKGMPAERDKPSPAAETPVTGVRKDQTIENIARIEAQMSEHWLSRKSGEDGAETRRTHIASAAVSREYDGGVTQPAHLQATQPLPLAPSPDPGNAPTIPIDMLAEPEAAYDMAAGSSSIAVEEASVRFANGEDAAAEQALRGALSQAPGSSTGRMAWQALLDLLACQGRREAYDDAASEYAVLFRVPAPAWPHIAHSPPMDAPVPAAASAAAAWTCPMVLDAAAVQSLREVLESPGTGKELDWSALLSADLPAAQALLTLTERVAETRVALRFVGSHVLRRRLKASTPSGRRENDPVWWKLRLAMLRIMSRAEEFDLAALDFCVTYGVLPPDWVVPQCSFEAAEAFVSTGPLEPVALVNVEPIKPLVTQLGGLDVLEWPTVSTDVPPLDLPSVSAAPVPDMLPPQDFSAMASVGPALSGALCGDIAAPLSVLQLALAKHPAGHTFVIDATHLVRVDFPAAGSLLQWLMAAIAQGVQPELVGVGRLVGTFLHVVGIDEAAHLRLKEY